MRYNKELVEKTAETPSQGERAAAIKWLSVQGEAIQIEAFRLQTDLLRQRREKGERVSPELAFSLLVLACRKMRFEEDVLHMKKRLNEEEAEKLQRRKMERFKADKKGKGSPKREMIRTRYYHLVQKLRIEDGLGWRNCAAYLKKYHNFDVTFSYLKAIIQELEKLHDGN
jgi:hypothetical protein